MGIEPTSSAWEAEVLPLNHTRNMSLILNDSLPTRDGISVYPSNPNTLSALPPYINTLSESGMSTPSSQAMSRS